LAVSSRSALSPPLPSAQRRSAAATALRVYDGSYGFLGEGALCGAGAPWGAGTAAGGAKSGGTVAAGGMSGTGVLLGFSWRNSCIA